MISWEHRCIFVHQRKCAGMAVIDAFGIEPSDPDFHFGNDGVLSPEWTERPDLVAEFLTFAVVRNPWDRFVSGWRYCASTRDRSITDVLRRPPRRGHDYRHVTRSQSATLFDPDGGLAVDRLLRFEHLEEDFAPLRGELGLPDRPLGRVNVGDRPGYHDLFDDRARRLFAKRFADDIERLGYAF